MPAGFPAPTFYLKPQQSFYVVHHTGLLDSFFNIAEHTLQDCNSDHCLSASTSPTAESSPLLPRVNKSSNYPIFLCVCHSCWPSIPQKKLFIFRFMIALYLTVALVLGFVYDHRCAQRTSKLFPFYATTVTSFIQIVYYWITAVWTLEHTVDPQYQLPPHEQAKATGKFLASLQSAVAVPYSTSSAAEVSFSIFYTAAVTFPLVVTVAYWLWIFPEHKFGPATGRSPTNLQYFSLVNGAVVNSALALCEILFLNGVGKQEPLAIHVSAVAAECIVFFWWMFFGRCWIDEYAYARYFDPAQVGWRALFGTYINMINLAIAVFIIQRGLHALRDRWLKRTEG